MQVDDGFEHDVEQWRCREGHIAESAGDEFAALRQRIELLENVLRDTIEAWTAVPTGAMDGHFIVMESLKKAAARLEHRSPS